MRPPLRRIAIAIAAALPPVLLGAAWMIHDRIAAATDAAVSRWAEGARKRGVNVALPEPTGGGGFPFAARRVFAAPAVTADGWRAEAAALVVEVSLSAPDAVTLAFVGPATFAGYGSWEPVTITEGARVTADLRTRTLAGGAEVPLAATAVLDSLTIPDAAGRSWRVRRMTLAAAASEPPPADHTRPGYTLEALVEGIEPPPELGLPGDGRAAAHLTVKGEPPSPTAPDLERWRRDGGTLELDRLETVIGPARLSGDGTLALDKGLQLEGALTLRGEGVLPLLDRLAAAGALALTPPEFAKVRSAAAMLTHPDPEGGPPRMTVPLFIQNHKVFAGPMPVAKLPPLRW